MPAQSDCRSARMCGAQMVIKCADIGHLAADHNIHKRWSYKLEEEFFRQVQPPKPTYSSWPVLHEEATPALWCPLPTINSACMRLMLSKDCITKHQLALGVDM